MYIKEIFSFGLIVLGSRELTLSSNLNKTLRVSILVFVSFDVKTICIEKRLYSLKVLIIWTYRFVIVKVFMADEALRFIVYVWSCVYGYLII